MNHNILNNSRILAIDDSRLNRAIIKKTLSELNMIVDEASDGIEGLAALEKQNYDLVLVDIVMPNMDGFDFLNRFNEYLKSKKIFIPVVLMTGTDDLNSKIKGLSTGADDFLLKPLNEKELIARIVSLLRLKNAYSEIYNKNMQLKKQLDAARKVQQFIIPKNFDFINYPKICGRYLPIEELGGDYFDCYRISEHLTGFLIADVTGHGISSALVMTMSKMIFTLYASKFESPEKLLDLVNSEIKSTLLDGQYVTAFYAIHDNLTKTLKFSNAGHTRALYYRASSGNILGLDTPGFFLGISDDGMYEFKTIKVEPGDRLFIYTDGLTEIRNNSGEEFGELRLGKFIKENRKTKQDNFCDCLLEYVNIFSRLEKRKDDLAFLIIEF